MKTIFVFRAGTLLFAKNMMATRGVQNLSDDESFCGLIDAERVPIAFEGCSLAGDSTWLMGGLLSKRAPFGVPFVTFESCSSWL